MQAKPVCSILVSSHNRLPLFRRTLWSMANRPPGVPFEVVVADDGSEEDVLGELRKYSSVFPWKFVRVDVERFERETGVRKFFNNPSLTNNVAFAHSRGHYVFLQGNEVVAWRSTYDRLLADLAAAGARLAFSTTLDAPRDVLESMGEYGDRLSEEALRRCCRFPLATPLFHTDVTNYLSLCTRGLWQLLGGYDERYVGGLGKEDSDFVRRCRASPGWDDRKDLVRSDAVSLHQSHGGRTWMARQEQSLISDERWSQGERLSKTIWDTWDGSHHNRQPWPVGEVGVVDVVSNV